MQLSKRLFAVSITSSLLFLHGCSFSSTTSEPSADGLQSTQTITSNQPSATDPFRDAANKAMEAANLTQTAKTSEEWSKVANTWQQAINLMKAVPESSTNYKISQRKAVEYQGNFKYAQRSSATPISAVQQPEQSTKQKLPISRQAAQLKMGMTYQEVVALLGRMPDTVFNDQIRQELGEPVQGNNLIGFDWKNDNPNCQPVSVQFDPSSMTANGWNQGRTCTGSSIFNEPFGKACSATKLCNSRLRSSG